MGCTCVCGAWPHSPAPRPHSGRSAHHSIGADGVRVTAAIVPIIALVHIVADLEGQTLGRTGPTVGLLQQSQDPVSSPEAPGPRKAKTSSSRSTQPDLFAGAGIVNAHTGHPSAFVSSRTGLTVEAGHGVDAAGPGEARVSVSTLRSRGGGGQAPACALPTWPHCAQTPTPGPPPSGPPMS